MKRKRYVKLLVSIGKSRNEANKIAECVRNRKGWTYQRHWDMIQCFRNSTFKITRLDGSEYLSSLDVPSCFIEHCDRTARTLPALCGMEVYELNPDWDGFTSYSPYVEVKEVEGYESFTALGELVKRAVEDVQRKINEFAEMFHELLVPTFQSCMSAMRDW